MKTINIIIIILICVLLIGSAVNNKSNDETELNTDVLNKIELVKGEDGRKEILIRDNVGKVLKRVDLGRLSMVEIGDGEYLIESRSLMKHYIFNKDTLNIESGRTLYVERLYKLPYNPDKEWVEVNPDKVRNRVIYMNNNGEERFIREVYSYDSGELTVSSFDASLSRNGNRILVMYLDSLEQSRGWKPEENLQTHVEIYDTLGVLIREFVRPGIYEKNFELSPDGKILGHEFYKDNLRHIYLLNIDTGEEKICKAEGYVDGQRWNFSAFPIGEGYISISLFEIPKQWKIPFSEIPEDLSDLLRGE